MGELLDVVGERQQNPYGEAKRRWVQYAHFKEKVGEAYEGWFNPTNI
jgi:hypothetical protein